MIIIEIISSALILAGIIFIPKIEEFLRQIAGQIAHQLGEIAPLVGGFRLFPRQVRRVVHEGVQRAGPLDLGEAGFGQFKRRGLARPKR